MKFFRTLLLGVIILTALHHGTFAQNLEDKKEFLQEQGTAFGEWMAEAGFGPVLVYDSLTVKPDRVTVKITMADSVHFARLDSAVQKQSGFTLSSILLNRLIFTMDLKMHDVVIVLSSKAKKAFISYEKPDSLAGEEIGWTVRQFFTNTQGGEEQVISIAIGDIRGLRDQCGEVRVLTTGNLQDELVNANRKVLEGLKKYLSKYNTGHTAYDLQDDGGTESIFLCSHLKGAIQANGYFEKIRIDLKYAERDGKINVSFIIQVMRAAAGTGKPFETDYRSYGSSANDAIDLFEKKIKMEINRILKG